LANFSDGSELNFFGGWSSIVVVKRLLIKDGSGAMARDGFVGRLLAAIPEYKIKFHGGDRMPGCVERSL
jgi:hypothetical protein